MRDRTNQQGQYKAKLDVTSADKIKDGYTLEPVPTGVENLGRLFFFSEMVDGELKVRQLGGYPRGAFINLTGSSDTGKSLMLQQFAVVNSERERIVFVTTESPKEYLGASLNRLASVMGLRETANLRNIVIIDLSRKGLPLKDLLYSLAMVIRRTGAKHLLIDSLTALFEDREVFARNVTRSLYRFSKRYSLTVLVSSQKREDSPFSSRAAGGLAIGHIVDCNIVLSKLIVSTPFEKKLYGKDIGDVVRTLRIDGCRLCGHSSKTFIMDITREGMVKVLAPLSKIRG